MLGRLFKQSSVPNLGALPQNQPLHPSINNPAANANTHDDSYTREILYASQLLTLKPLLFNPRRFRLLVCQDGGNLRSKQVLFDSAADLAPNSPASLPGMSPVTSGGVTVPTTDSVGKIAQKTAALALSRNKLSGRLGGGETDAHVSPKTLLLLKHLYNVNNINDYMFGRGLPTNECCAATKIHYLSHVNLAYGNHLAVLVTKLFLIIDASSSYADKAQAPLYDANWHPAAAFPTKDSYYDSCGRSCRNSAQQPDLALAARSSFHSRFSIGIIIPLDSPDQTAEEILSSNWDVISHYFVILQRVVSKKLIQALKYSTVNGVCPHINNRRIQFPPNILRADAELTSQLNKFVRLLFFNANVPRLISSNSLIKYSVDHPNSKFKPLLLNWALEVVNWLEFKDGRNFLAGHASNSSQLGSYSHSGYSHIPAALLSRSGENLSLSDTFLASLLALLAPYKKLLTLSPLSLDSQPNSTCKEITRVVVMTGNSAVAKKLIFIINGIIPDSQLLSRIAVHDYTANDSLKDEQKGPDSLDKSVESSLTVKNIPIVKPPLLISPESANSSVSPKAPTTLARPIPIKQSTSSLADSPSDESMSVSVRSTKGWEVPVKASTSLSTSSAKKPSFTTEPTAVAQQIPMHGRNSLSNSSSMAYLSSSLNSSLSSSASNYSFSKLGGSFMEKWKNSLVSTHHSYAHLGFDTPELTQDVLNKRPSILSLRTPSPAYEYDEPLWESPSQSCTSLSPAKLKISRTQSMLDLYNHTLSQQKRPVANEMPPLNLKRTMSSVYVPLQSERGQDILGHNNDHIKQKCAQIMRARVSHGPKTDLCLTVNPIVVTGTMFGEQTAEQTRITQQHSNGADASASNGSLVTRKCALSPNVAFVDEFRPEYGVQSCPVNPKLEVLVMNAMKNDLLFFQNNCGYEKVTSRTVFISLRAREIKLIEMNVGGHDKPTTPQHGISVPIPPFASTQMLLSVSSSPPVSSFFQNSDSSYAQHERKAGSPGTNYSTVIRKIFTPKSISGDKAAIQAVGTQLERLSRVVAKINNDGAATTPQDKELFNGTLFSTVLLLIL